jgi:hypothetical protein
MKKQMGSLLLSACSALLTSASFLGCSDEAPSPRPDLSFIYSDNGKVDIILPATFAGGAANPSSLEAAFVAEIEHSILQTIELFPNFRPSSGTSNGAKAISIQRVDLYKQRTVSLVSGTNTAAGSAAGSAVEVSIAGAKFSGSLLYDVNFSEWSAVVRGTVAGVQPFMIALGKPYLRRYDKVQFKYSGNVDADLLKLLPEAVGALITKAFGDIFTIRGGYVSDSQFQDFVALALMRNIDMPGEVSEFVEEFAHKLADKCDEWRNDYPDLAIESCLHDPIQVTPVDEAFSLKVNSLGKVADSSTMMRVTQCRALNESTYLLYVPYFLKMTTSGEHFLYHLGQSEVWQPMFINLFGYADIKAEYLASEDSTACGNSTGDCTVFKYNASYFTAGQMARTCDLINSCSKRSPQFALSGALQKSVIELGAKKSDCAVMTPRVGPWAF